MWPSSYSSDLTKRPCPKGIQCTLPNCIFTHAPPTSESLSYHVAAPTAFSRASGATATAFSPGTAKQHPQPKRLKLDPQVAEPPTSSKGDNAVLPRPATVLMAPSSLKNETEAASETETEVKLLPRKMKQEPAVFSRRKVLLETMHNAMKPLNDRLQRAVKPEIRALHLSTNLLNKAAVEEELKLASEHAAVYENRLKQRILAYRKMSLEEWVKLRRGAIAEAKGGLANKAPFKRVHTLLYPDEEYLFLPHLKATEAALEAHGVITEMSTEAELKDTRTAQQCADHWETCARCDGRFQVFPDRRESDGALTTGGKCRHHWGKKFYPKQERGQPKEPARWSCCNESLGTLGCTVSETHAFKISDKNRLSLVMPFIHTPANDKVDPKAAVCFDCEMGYTTYGLELMRLTVISWPNHKPLLDILVRPLGNILDFNTRFSGITQDQFLNAKPYDPENPKPMRSDLRIVESPYIARDLFLSHVSPQTPVIAHAIENDLSSIRLIHPTIVDTVILFPTRSGLPYRHGLKALAKMYLDIDIQQAGAAGHDSYEDARTTGELVRVKVAEKWKELKTNRWTITNGVLLPPLPSESPPPMPAPVAPSMMGAGAVSGDDGKRKRESDEDSGADG